MNENENTDNIIFKYKVIGKDKPIAICDTLEEAEEVSAKNDVVAIEWVLV